MYRFIFIPTIFNPKTYVTDRVFGFFKLLRDNLGFQIKVTDQAGELPYDTEIVIAYRSPQHTNPSTMMDLARLDKKIKLICYFEDLHGDQVNFFANMTSMLRRCDLVLSERDEFFRDIWLPFVKKFVFFPPFFSPDDRFLKFGLNKKPIMKCLLTGIINAGAYPLRAHLAEMAIKHPDLIDILPHPGYVNAPSKEKAIIREDYVKCLNNYFCCVTGSSKFNYLLAKYFEIPASGSLLLADRTKDSDKVGLVPFKHYVPIDKGNALASIKDCLSRPYKYEEIRKEGMAFVRANHGTRNRLEQFKEIFKEL